MINDGKKNNNKKNNWLPFLRTSLSPAAPPLAALPSSTPQFPASVHVMAPLGCVSHRDEATGAVQEYFGSGSGRRALTQPPEIAPKKREKWPVFIASGMLEVLLVIFGGGEGFEVWGGGGMETGVVVAQAGALCSSSVLSPLIRAWGDFVSFSGAPEGSFLPWGDPHSSFQPGDLLGPMGSPVPGP